MKRYVYRNHQQCTCPTRREIREAVTSDINERPQQRTEVQVPSTNIMRYDQMRYDMFDMPWCHRYVFETMCFSSMMWIEEHVENGVSCGYYATYNSYFQVPQGVDLPESQLMNEGHTYYDDNTEPYRGMDGEAYYRYRIHQLEDRLRELEQTRIILPREEINDIHSGKAIINNQPVRLEYFEDDEIFNI